MEVTGWKGPVLGIRIGKANANRYFDRSWVSVEIELDGHFIKCPLTGGFWKECPEIRSKEIERWLIGNKLFPWPNRVTPKLKLEQVKGSQFRLTR